MRKQKAEVTLDSLESELMRKVGDAEERLREALRNYLGALQMSDMPQVSLWEDLALNAVRHADTLLDEFPRQAAGLKWLTSTARHKAPELFELGERDG